MTSTDPQGARWVRREQLVVLLSRMQRGVLLPAERDLLRAAVETELTDAEAAHAEAERLRAEARIILRDCLMPGCMRQFDVGAHMEGRTPVRPEWSGDRWQMFRGLLPGRDYGCPEHAPLIARHMTHVAQAGGLTSAVCACRQWTATRRWHGAARALWEEHLLDIAAEAAALPADQTTEEPT